MIELFAKSQAMGIFKGFNERGYEFAAEIVAPYDASMLDRPQLGQFILVELGNPSEASLGRITRFVPSGLLAAAEGEDYINAMQMKGAPIPEDLKKLKLKYRVQIKLLGAMRIVGEDILFVPSHRRLPHLGAQVAMPSSEVLRKICSLSGGDTELGDFVLGEFVFRGQEKHDDFDFFRSLSPRLSVTFNIGSLASRRTVVFARAGYGKSNLIKYLISELYRKGQPTTERGRKVGVLIFDADGEYFWPDYKGRPGLCDVPHVKDRIVVFTNRSGDLASRYYESWKAGSVKMDIRYLPPRDVIGIAVSPDRQGQQNVIKLKSLSTENWRLMVDLIHRHRLQAKDEEVGALLGYTKGQVAANSAEISAARSNMFNVVNHLHNPESNLIHGAMDALKDGHVVIVDISLLSSTAGYHVAGLLLRRLFSYNQENFTGGASPVPVIAVIEEAQSVLGRQLDESSPFVEWVKEGRKYDLGAILVTQQPGSLSPELLSQADNWFCFHLLSAEDASVLGRHNSHFSDDVLAHLIGEPIAGNCYLWSAPKQPFVLPVRVRSFEALYAGEVASGEDAQAMPPYEGSPAAAIRNMAQTKYTPLAEKLGMKIKELVKQKSLAIEKVDKEHWGIKSGRLYYLIMDVVPKEEAVQVDRYKSLLMAILLGVEPVIKKHKEKVYYCAPLKVWRDFMGR